MLPSPALHITRAALGGDYETAHAESDRLAPLWGLVTEYRSSLRVIAAIAEHLGLVQRPSLPRPILGLDDEQRARVVEVIDELELTG